MIKKYMIIYIDNQAVLERYLNEQSNLGYHAEEVNLLGIK